MSPEFYRNVNRGFFDDKEVLKIMVGDIKISQELINKLNIVQEFIYVLYSGRQQYKDRIAFIANTLGDVIEELKAIQGPPDF